MAKRKRPAPAPRGAQYYRDRAAKLRGRVERKAIRAASKGKDTPKVVGAAELYPGLHISDRMLELIERQADQNRLRRGTNSRHDPFKIHWSDFPPSCRPPEDVQLAMDDNLSWASSQWASGGPLGALFAQGLAFPGYPFLSELAQRPEYRTAFETLSSEMVRKWIKISGRGQGKPGSEEFKESAGKKTREKAERIKELEEFLNGLGIRNAYKMWAAHDFSFGRGHLFHEFGDNDAMDPAGLAEIKSPIGDPTAPEDSKAYKLAKAKCTKNHPLTGLRCVEPVWTYPTTYNATNPLRRDWYAPQIWYTMGQEIHISRLFLLVGQPVPDLMKPSYSFGGISLSQLGQESVNIWLETRASIGRLIHAFSTMVLKTDLQTTMQPGGEAMLMKRVALFNAMRDNNQTFILNNDTEDFSNVSVPLSGLEGLQAQAQEHLCVAKGTLIDTNRGAIPIENVTLSDKVLTRKGYAPLQWCGITGRTKQMVEIKVAGRTLRTTPCHPIWSQTVGAFVPARSVQPSHTLFGPRTSSPENMALPSHGAVIGGDRQKPDTIGTSKPGVSFIAEYMKCMWDRFQRAITCITAMMTEETINRSIWRLSPVPSMFPVMSASGSTSLTLDMSFSAKAAEKRLLRSNCARNIAATPVGSPHMSVESVKRVELESEVPVYNLSVAPGYPPEFFAEGVLTHNCSVWRIPSAVYTGISPTGLNASSEGEIRIFENTIHGMQELRWRHPLAKTIAFGMLSLWGEVDRDIVFDFQPLREMTEKENAEIQKLKAETDDLHVNGTNSLHPEEVRMRIAQDPDSGYENIDPDDVPEPPAMPGIDPETGEPLDPAGGEGAKPGGRLNISGHEEFAGNAKPPKKAANDRK